MATRVLDQVAGQPSRNLDPSQPKVGDLPQWSAGKGASGSGGTGKLLDGKAEFETDHGAQGSCL